MIHVQALPVGDNGCAGGNIVGCSNGDVATAEGTACGRGATWVFTKFTFLLCLVMRNARIYLLAAQCGCSEYREMLNDQQ